MKRLFVYIGGWCASRRVIPASVRDFILWPIASRALGLPYSLPVALKDGFVMKGSMEDILSRQTLFIGPWRKHFWEPKTSRRLEAFARDAREILIAGSHIGYDVLLAAKATSGRVHAFEPVPALYERSRENFALNPGLATRITLNRAALGESKGDIEFYAEDIRSSAIPYSGGHVAHHNRIRVPLTTIDIYAREKGIRAFDLILLDIEGFEWFALNGAADILRHKPALILEVSPKILAHTRITEKMILGRLDSLGYQVEYLDQDADYANILATSR